MRLTGALIIMRLMSLMVLTGCTSSDSDLPENQGRAVGFGVYTQQFQTRATTPNEITKSIADGESIGVYAYLHDNTRWPNESAGNPAANESSPTAIPNFMFNQQVTYNQYYNAYVYSPMKYWPNTDEDKVSFIAYYPYCNGSDDDGTDNDIESTNVTPRLTASTPGLPTFSYTVEDEATNQLDFLVSDLLPNLPNGSQSVTPSGTGNRDGLTVTDRVKFILRHALAKVEFRITVDERVVADVASFKLNDLYVTNIYKDGLLTPYYSSATGETSLDWSSGSNIKDKYQFITYKSQLLMPQTLREDAVIHLDFEMTFKSDGTSYTYDGSGNPVAQQDYTYSKVTDVTLKEMKSASTGAPLEEWKANHHYVYNIRLGANRIDFTGTVVEWGETVAWDGINVDQLVVH